MEIHGTARRACVLHINALIRFKCDGPLWCLPQAPDQFTSPQYPAGFHYGDAVWVFLLETVQFGLAKWPKPCVPVSQRNRAVARSHFFPCCQWLISLNAEASPLMISCAHVLIRRHDSLLPVRPPESDDVCGRRVCDVSVYEFQLERWTPLLIEWMNKEDARNGISIKFESIF